MFPTSLTFFFLSFLPITPNSLLNSSRLLLFFHEFFSEEGEMHFWNIGGLKNGKKVQNEPDELQILENST